MKKCVKTADLTPRELVTIFKERTAVFVVEQNCPYQEVDDVDYDVLHYGIWSDTDDLKGYTRIIDRGERISFGRVLVTKDYRGQKLGEELVVGTIEEIAKRFPGKDIEISAQTYLLPFYQKFGFEITSETYLEDDIEHNDMLLKVEK